MHHGGAGPEHVCRAVGFLRVGHRPSDVEFARETPLQVLARQAVLLETRPVDDLLVEQVLVLVRRTALVVDQSLMWQVHALVAYVQSVVGAGVCLAEARRDERR